VRSSLPSEGFKYFFVGIDPAGLRTRNQFGAKRSKFCDPQIALQSFTRKVAFGNPKSGALTLKGPI